MNRRTVLLGVCSAALGGGAFVGSGSRIESQRGLRLRVTTDGSAFLGMTPLATPNSNEYVTLGEDGSLTIDITDHDSPEEPDTRPGTGVNSGAVAYFDGMFELCNRGSEAACLGYTLPEGVVANGVGAQTVSFYSVERDADGEVTNRRIIEAGQKRLLELGECAEMGVRTVTPGIRPDEGPLVDGEVVVTAAVDGDCVSD